MNEKLIHVASLMDTKQWSQAIKLIDQFVSNYCTAEETTAYLWKRVQCNYELKKYDFIIKDCRHLLHLMLQKDAPYVGICARYMLVWALLKSNRLIEVKKSCEEWLSSPCKPPVNSESEKVLKKLHSTLRSASITKKHMKNLTSLMEETLRTWVFSLTPGDSYCKNLQMNGEVVTPEESSSDTLVTEREALHMALTPMETLRKFDEHTSGLFNETVLDGETKWKWRLPPRGFTAETYTLCESYIVRGFCRYSTQCVEAHSNDELAEWRERFELRKREVENCAVDSKGQATYTEQILEKWSQASSSDEVMKEKVDGVDDKCSDELKTTVVSKVSEREWTFTFVSTKLLRAIALLQDTHRDHFYVKEVIIGNDNLSRQLNKHQVIKKTEQELCQEWLNENQNRTKCETNYFEQVVKICFRTQIYGTFRQSIVFDFGEEPYLVKHLCVDVVPEEVGKIQEIYKEMTLSSRERWDDNNVVIVPFDSPVYPGLPTPHSPGDGTREHILLTKYPLPKMTSCILTPATVNEKHVNQENYRSRMHELLFVEELARLEQVSRYNISCTLLVARSYLLAPAGVAASTAKYVYAGELFGVMTLTKDISEDTSAGRLILNNCTTVLVGPQSRAGGMAPMRVYEAYIEDKGKNTVYIRLPSAAVTGLGTVADTEFKAEVQFQMNRLTFCEWHCAIDQIQDLGIIFPKVLGKTNIPWSPDRQWNESLEPKMNSKQKEAVVAITTPIERCLPPILLIGPFGTGKTYTIAQAIRQLLLQKESRILICTHSNSAADLYIKDYLHPWYEGGLQEAKPLRIYYHKRWVATVNPIVQKYCLIEMSNGARCFRLPTLEDVMGCRIIVVTLAISMYLSTLGLPKGFFTHLFLDEAAQAMESEALMPLALANAQSRLVLAGDHMQLSPEVYSKFAEERNLQVSLLERLYEHYPPTFPCKILLCENYRAHQAIVDFTSELFYDQKLISSGRQPKHDKFYPLTFFTTRGEDIQDVNSTAFYNSSEVYELVERICELKRSWPDSWGKMDDISIGVMTPYADQVFRIRSELRKRRMGNISVERVLNVQGKEFRVVFLSTVRTRRTCVEAEADYGFLSDLKLLNTAITRARSMVAVVGDPVALCSVGRCRKLWERFLQICHENQSLFGITWSLLKFQLDGVELKKSFVLNPLAPEFVPRAVKVEMYNPITLPVTAPPHYPVYFQPNFSPILPNGTNILSCFPPQQKHTVPDAFRFRPPFLGPLSSSYSIPIIPLRHPENFRSIRPIIEEPQIPVLRQTPETSYGSNRLMNAQLSSSNISHNISHHQSPLPKPEVSYPPPVVQVPTSVYRVTKELPLVPSSETTHSPLRPPYDSQYSVLRANTMPNGIIMSNSASAIDKLSYQTDSESLYKNSHSKVLQDELMKRTVQNNYRIDPRPLNVSCEPIPSSVSKSGTPTQPFSSVDVSPMARLNLQHKPDPDNIQFYQNVHFPKRVMVPMPEEPNFVSNINQMFSERVGECGWAERGAGGGVPLYARAPRSAGPETPYPESSSTPLSQVFPTLFS